MNHPENAPMAKLLSARKELREFTQGLTMEELTSITSGDPTTVKVMGLKAQQSALIENIVKAQQELQDAKQKAQA